MVLDVVVARKRRGISPNWLTHFETTFLTHTLTHITIVHGGQVSFFEYNDQYFYIFVKTTNYLFKIMLRHSDIDTIFK